MTRKSRREIERALEDLRGTDRDDGILVVQEGDDGQLRADVGEGRVVDPAETDGLVIRYPKEAAQY